MQWQSKVSADTLPPYDDALLRRELDAFHSGERPNYELMLDIISYLREYSDEMHHPREDVAFVGHADNLLLSGVLRTSFIEETVKIACPTVRAVNVPRSGRFRFICYIALEKMQEGEAKLAAMAAFVADPFLKFVVVVDHDVDINSDTDVAMNGTAASAGTDRTFMCSA